MERPLRVAVIGCGAIAQMMHLPTLGERPDLFTITGLAEQAASPGVEEAPGDARWIEMIAKELVRDQQRRAG